VVNVDLDLGAVTKTRVYADSTMSWSEPIHRYEFLKFVLKNMANDDLEGMYAVDRSQLIRFGGTSCYVEIMSFNA